MTTFTDWDIIRNLLLAGRWTVLLSLVAFTGGALVTLRYCCCASPADAG